MSLLPLAWTAVLAYVVDLLLLLGLHLRFRHYSPLVNPVSDYGVGPSAPSFTVYGLLGSLGALALAGGFWASGVVPPWIALALIGMVAVRIGVNVVPTDVAGQPSTTRGRIHLLFAICTFTLAYVVIDNATPVLLAIDGANLPLGALRWIVAASLAGVVIALLVRPLRRIFGAVERVFLVGTLLWFLAAALALTQTTGG